MPRILKPLWPWLAVYLVVIGGIAVYTIHLRNSMLADRPGIAKNEQSWQAWRAEAAKQDGTHGPVERVVPPTDEPPMLMMMRDNFPVVLGASVFFPAIILGFLLAVLRGVLLQSDSRHQAASEKQRGSGPT